MGMLINSFLGGPTPQITSSAAVSVVENSVLAHTLTANYPGTWTTVGGADAAKFLVSGNTLRWVGNGTKDFETPDDADTNNVYQVIVDFTP
jgi:hypothetical protein